MYAGSLQPTDEIARPTDRHGAARERIFQDQTPTDDPRRRLAHHGIRVRVGAAGRWNQRRELRVSERGARADDAGNEESEDDGRSRAIGTDAGERINSRADDRADAERDQMRPAQRLLQRAAGLMRPADLERLARTQNAQNVLRHAATPGCRV